MTFLLLMMACSGKIEDSALPEVDPLTWAVDAPGPYRVGYRGWEHTFTSLADGSERTILVNAWYPTEDTEGEDVRYIGVYQDTESLGGAEPAASVYEGGYPVHIYSHGDMGWGGASADLMRYYASHGWVVVAPDHTGNTLVDGDADKPTALYIHRPQDTIETLNALESLDASDPLATADTSSVFMSGHSFGCYTTWTNLGAPFDETTLESECAGMAEGSCTDQEKAAFLSGELSDDRIVAGLTMAGAIRRGFVGDTGHLGVHGPMMLMSGTNDSDGIPSSWDSLEGIERSWVEIEGGCHQTFGLGSCETLEAETGFQIVDTYALAFGRQAVLDDTDATVQAIVEGSLEVATEATLVTGE